ncbi:unnamed protein product [Closterium sp. NIES-65]|nr:unnamed protein product [Closterium sp. NIES-65]
MLCTPKSRRTEARPLLKLLLRMWCAGCGAGGSKAWWGAMAGVGMACACMGGAACMGCMRAAWGCMWGRGVAEGAGGGKAGYGGGGKGGQKAAGGRPTWAGHMGGWGR